MRSQAVFSFPRQTAARTVRVGQLLVVQEWQRVVLFRRGASAGLLQAGGHRIWRRHVTGWWVDTRPWITSVPTQEIPTADGVTVKFTAAAQARIADPGTYVVAAQDVLSVLYLRIQVALRDVVAATSVDDLLHARGSVTERLSAAIDVSDLGLVLDQVELKDIVLPADLKRAQADILLAKAQGQASLERARAETATLRSLANAARIASETPALLDLRLIQQLESTSGHTIVIGTPYQPRGKGQAVEGD